MPGRININWKKKLIFDTNLNIQILRNPSSLNYFSTVRRFLAWRWMYWKIQAIGYPSCQSRKCQGICKWFLSASSKHWFLTGCLLWDTQQISNEGFNRIHVFNCQAVLRQILSHPALTQQDGMVGNVEWE